VLVGRGEPGRYLLRRVWNAWVRNCMPAGRAMPNWKGQSNSVKEAE
jgi:hypothetical protein